MDVASSDDGVNENEDVEDSDEEDSGKPRKMKREMVCAKRDVTNIL